MVRAILGGETTVRYRSFSILFRFGIIMSRLDVSVRSATRIEILFRKLEKVDNSCTVLSGLVATVVRISINISEVSLRGADFIFGGARP